MNLAKLRVRVSDALADSTQRRAHLDIPEGGAFGHAAGDPAEAWCLDLLSSALPGVGSYWVHKFLTHVLEERRPSFGSEPTAARVKERLDADTWWSPLLANSGGIDSFLESGECAKWQQAGADLALAQGSYPYTSAEDLVLLNVKSHAVGRNSRPPNIMSGQRLLEFFDNILSRPDSEKLLAAVNLWFVGIGYLQRAPYSVESTRVLDLFRIDVAAIPQINFDAAIQIQFHVSEMPEKDQTKEDFIYGLSERFLEDWQHHVSSKNSRFSRLVKRIQANLSCESAPSPVTSS